MHLVVKHPPFNSGQFNPGMQSNGSLIAVSTLSLAEVGWLVFGPKDIRSRRTEYGVVDE